MGSTQQHKKTTVRKIERSRPGIRMPDVRGTIEALMGIIEVDVLGRLLRGEASHLVIATKEPQIRRLPPLPGVRAVEPARNGPESRSARKLRDGWRKDEYLGFVYVIRGEADLLLCRKVIACHAGNFVFVMPQTWRNQGNASHWERPGIEQSDSDVLWITFNTDGALLHFCKSRGAGHAISPVLFIPDTSLFTLIDLFSAEVLDGEVTASATQLLWLLFDRSLRKLQKNRVLSPEHIAPVDRTAPAPTTAAERARGYVDANLGEKLTLAIVAREVHISRTKLAHDFQEHTGEAFGAYLTRRRIENAQHLLKTTTLTVAGISWMSGFSNPNYFSTAFRRHTGLSPLQYRDEK